MEAVSESSAESEVRRLPGIPIRRFSTASRSASELISPSDKGESMALPAIPAIRLPSPPEAAILSRPQLFNPQSSINTEGSNRAEERGREAFEPLATDTKARAGYSSTAPFEKERL